MIKLFKFSTTKNLDEAEDTVNTFISTENAAGRRWRTAGPIVVENYTFYVTLIWDEYK
jgi:hypothetical protein